MNKLNQLPSQRHPEARERVFPGTFRRCCCCRRLTKEQPRFSWRAQFSSSNIVFPLLVAPPRRFQFSNLEALFQKFFFSLFFTWLGDGLSWKRGIGPGHTYVRPGGWFLGKSEVLLSWNGELSSHSYSLGNMFESGGGRWVGRSIRSWQMNKILWTMRGELGNVKRTS